MKIKNSTRSETNLNQNWPTVAVLLSSLLLCGCTARDDAARLEELFEVASWQGPEEAVVAIEEIKAIESSPADEMLIVIALGRTPTTNSATMAKAMAALAERRTAQAAHRLAALLAPHHALPVRRAAVNTLLTLGCGVDCMRQVMHSRERLWRGEPSNEDRIISKPVPGLTTEQNLKFWAPTREEQRHLDEDLKKLMLVNQDSVLDVLEHNYSIRSMEASPFSWHVVATLRLTAACPALLDSERIWMIGGKDTVPAELTSTIEAAGCR